MSYSDAQAEEHRLAGLEEVYAGLYFELLKRHDEFHYLDRSRFSVNFDSKEHFDKTFSGNWFYYDGKGVPSAT